MTFRRCFAFLAAAFALVTDFALSQNQPITASAVISRIEQQSGVTVPATTVDRFKAGDPQARVTGITVTMMATLDVLKQAAARGDNLVITHEPTFYSHRDTLAVLESENDAVLADKRRFIREHGLVIWRFHDFPHTMKPDMINAGITRALGWQRYQQTANPVAFNLPEQTLRALATGIGYKLGAKAIRISGNPAARVRTAVVTQGFPGFPTNRHAIQSAKPDVVIIGEDHEWETIEYVVDAISEGRIKGLIVLGHVPSEQAGMDEFARWLKTFVTEVPVHFIPTADPFRSLR
ncbi:MAG: Nif3-like dinuclear metal center hexameric protein [Gemmatimonadaceae bacterium]